MTHVMMTILMRMRNPQLTHIYQHNKEATCPHSEGSRRQGKGRKLAGAAISLDSALLGVGVSSVQG